MIKTFEPYIDTDFRYSFLSGPDAVRTPEEALRLGINCISLAHFVLTDLFNVQLPETLGFAETCMNREMFQEVHDGAPIKAGDLQWFGLADAAIEPHEFVPKYKEGQLINWADFPVKHVAIYTGVELDGEPLLLHSTDYTGTNSMWKLSEFANNRKRCQKLYGVTRLKRSSHLISE